MDKAAFFEAASITELEGILTTNSDADLLLMDLHMPGANGFVGLAHVIKNYPQLPVVMISANENNAIIASAQRYGSLGFIAKSTSILEMIDAIEKVLMGELAFPPGFTNFEQGEQDELDEQAVLINKIAELTPKQLEVFNLLADGLLNKQIAYQQAVTEATIKAHVTAIMRKLNVYNRTQVVLIASKVNIDEDYGSVSV